MSINLTDDLNIANHIRRQESFGSDGKYQVFSAELKGVHLQHFVFQLTRNADIELRFNQTTFIFCLGRSLDLAVSNGKKFVLEPKQVMVFKPSASPAKLHIKLQGNYQIFSITLTAEINTEIADRIYLEEGSDLFFENNICLTNDEVDIVKRLVEVQPSQNMQSAINQVWHLISLVLQKLNAPSAEANNNEVVEKARDYILANLSTKKTPIQFCCEAGLTETTHYNVFYKKYGLTPQEFITQARFEKARHLLANTSQTLSEVAQAIGFISPSGLAYIFQKKLKQTAAEYRNYVKGQS